MHAEQLATEAPAPRLSSPFSRRRRRVVSGLFEHVFSEFSHDFNGFTVND